MRNDAFAFELTGNVVHLWTAPLDASAFLLNALQANLSAPEREIAARYAFPHLRHASILSRGILRLLLAQYTKAAPQSLNLIFSPQGKPSLVGHPSLDFNVSHSGNLAIYAFTPNCPIGVDIELLRPMNDIQDMATRFFSVREHQDLMSLPESLRLRSFYDCWTRKEAYLKATGLGLSLPLDSFCVSLKPDEHPRFIYLPEQLSASSTWTLQDLTPQLPSTHAGALAYPGHPRQILYNGFLDSVQLSLLLGIPPP